MAKILVAEDEPDIQNLILITLQQEGHAVTIADNGEIACQKALADKPDLILLDVKMPRLNGYETCKRLKAEPELQGIPVVFLSVRGADDEIQAGFEVGADEYLVKPFAPDELSKRVTQILSGR